MQKNYGLIKPACYMVSMTMSVVANLPPLLFLTFRSLYSISYSLLGLLIFINFFTQLSVDLIFSFFSHKFNMEKTVKLTPVIGAAGLLIFSLWPFVFPDNVYLGFVLGTLIFSAASGLAEVLISPVIAAIPAENPDREMSKLHSVYAWGVVGVIIFSGIFIALFGTKNWQWLMMLFVSVPLSASILYLFSTVPPMETPEKISGALELAKNKGLWLCVITIFFGGAAECSMAQWASGYLEQALKIPKVFGDIFGVAMFSVMLGLGRTMYAKKGKNIGRVLFICAISASVCYLVCALTTIPLAGLIFCALTGLCTSMMWPGSLIVSTDKFPAGGVFVYAIMAAGGDLGASVAPQLIGIVCDFTIKNQSLVNLAANLNLTPDQLGMKLGLFVGFLFPLMAIFTTYKLWKSK